VPRYRAVTDTQLRAFADSYLGDDNRVSLVFVPSDGAPVSVS